jgi:hypothetical protein
MALDDQDISTNPTDSSPEGPADSGAGQPSDPTEHDGGADGGADQRQPEKEGPADAGAAGPVDPAEHDGGADGGA